MDINNPLHPFNPLNPASPVSPLNPNNPASPIYCCNTEQPSDPVPHRPMTNAERLSMEWTVLALILGLVVLNIIARFIRP